MYRAEWESTIIDATFYIFVNGEEYGETTSNLFDFPVGEGETVTIDVFDVIGQTPEHAFPSNMTLAWLQIDGFQGYRIEKFVNAAWVVLETLAQEDYRYRTFVSETLEDETVHDFRIVPIGGDGNDGTPLPVSGLMVRRPDNPEFTAVYDDPTRTITIDVP